jgi:hypothetical protein
MIHNVEEIAKEMAEFTSDIVKVRIEAIPGGPYEDARMFLVWLPIDVPKGTLTSLCMTWAPLIRKSVPEADGEWASFISVRSPLGSTLGVYCIGWAGQEDAWQEDKESGWPIGWSGKASITDCMNISLRMVKAIGTGVVTAMVTTIFSMSGAATRTLQSLSAASSS